MTGRSRRDAAFVVSGGIFFATFFESFMKPMRRIATSAKARAMKPNLQSSYLRPAHRLAQPVWFARTSLQAEGSCVAGQLGINDPEVPS